MLIGHCDNAYISDLYIEQRQAEVEQRQVGVGHLYLIFREHIGVEVFSFLSCEEYSQDSIPNNFEVRYFLLHDNEIVDPTKFAEALKPSAVLEKHNVDIFDCLTGYHCSGKTFFIKKALYEMQVDFRLFVSVAEDFSVHIL
jgi:hypothetical protein